MFVILNKTTIFAVCYNNIRQFCTTLNFATMKAFITKDDDFKTIGFQVENNDGHTLYTWGINHASPFYFSKEVATEPILDTIFLLQKLDAKLSVLDNFFVKWFEVARKNPNVKVDGGVNFKENEEAITSIKATINTLINSIK